MQMCKVYVH